MVFVTMSPRCEAIHRAAYELYREVVGFTGFGVDSHDIHRWAYDQGLITLRELESLLRYESFTCTSRYS